MVTFHNLTKVSELCIRVDCATQKKKIVTTHYLPFSTETEGKVENDHGEFLYLM